MNTDRLFEFRTLAQVLHYGRAAEKLYMAQSVLSRHIQALEKDLGVQLFQRSPHGVTLTTAGAALYRASWDYLQANEQAVERVRSAGIGVAGSVHFACLRPVMRNAIEDFLGYFEKICPGVLLTADVLSTPEECDLTTYHCLAMPSSAIKVPDCFRLRAVTYEKSWLVFPSGHQLQPGGKMSLSQLAGETLLYPAITVPLVPLPAFGRWRRRRRADGFISSGWALRKPPCSTRIWAKALPSFPAMFWTSGPATFSMNMRPSGRTAALIRCCIKMSLLMNLPSSCSATNSAA